MRDQVGLFSFFFIPNTVKIKQLLQTWWDISILTEGLNAVPWPLLVLRLTEEVPNATAIALFVFQKQSPSFLAVLTYSSISRWNSFYVRARVLIMSKL